MITSSQTAPRDRSATLRGLGFVVLDEVHYLADPA
jgi:superfamily II RNA helicase